MPPSASVSRTKRDATPMVPMTHRSVASDERGERNSTIRLDNRWNGVWLARTLGRLHRYPEHLARLTGR